jgi:pyridoxamine 5'-phosphate oxidase
MDRPEIMDFIRKNHLCYLATVEGNKPHVRGMDMFRADENGIIFYTGKSKDVYQQIVKNPEVEVCFAAEGSQVRVSGRMEIVEDKALKNEIVAARLFLKSLHEESGFETMGVLRLAKCKVTTWSMQDMAAPKTFIDL